ncbi:hypothetical protein [Streptomyces yangpuensis]|uniref:hypothetical protein n=1 Tax=Streptomyces yangpuensis TaxID=1648182 RepID=UPI0037F85194
MRLLGFADTIRLVTIACCVGQAVMNVYQAAITSVVPDRVPVSARGRASAAVGLGLPFGSSPRALIGAVFSEDYRTGYLVLGAPVAGTAALFTARGREERLPARAPLPVRSRLAAVDGPAFGCYMAVDTALVTMVLPNAEDAARDMGVLNIANAGPADRRTVRRRGRPVGCPEPSRPSPSAACTEPHQAMSP